MPFDIKYSRVVLMGYRDLSLGAKETYQLLLYFAGNDKYCSVSQEMLAKIKDRSITMVSLQLKELKEAGLIRIERVGLNKSNVYYILDVTCDDSYLKIQDELNKITDIFSKPLELGQSTFNRLATNLGIAAEFPKKNPDK